MSFHEDMFHETKRDRKYFEGKKQKALKAIVKLSENDDEMNKLSQRSRDSLADILNLVNDI